VGALYSNILTEPEVISDGQSAIPAGDLISVFGSYVNNRSMSDIILRVWEGGGGEGRSKE
jgi:hypothetical protein